MIVLDTDVLTLIQRRSGQQYESLARYLDAQEPEVFVTVISFEEQIRGWMAFISKAKSASAQVLPYQKLHSLLEDFKSRPILDFDEPAVASLERLRREKIRVGTMDMKIAAIVIANDATLVTLISVGFQTFSSRIGLSDSREAIPSRHRCQLEMTLPNTTPKRLLPTHPILIPLIQLKPRRVALVEQDAILERQRLSGLQL